MADGRPAESTETRPEVGVDLGRSRTPRQLKICVVSLDAVAIGLGMLGAYALSRDLHPFDTGSAQPVSLLIAVLSLPLWLGIFAQYGLYKARRVSNRLDEVGALVHATVASTLTMAALSFLLKVSVSRGWLILCLPASFALCLIEREAVRSVFRRLHSSGRLLRSVVVVGANSEAESLCELLNNPALGYQVVGVVDDGDRAQLGAIPVLGRVCDTLEVVRATGATGAMVATTAITAAESNWLVRELMAAGIHVEMSSTLRGIFAGRLRVRPLGTTPVVYIEPVCRGGWRAVAKRSFDLVCAGLGLVVLAPLFLIVTVAIKLDSRGRVVFSQTRVGKLGVPFKMLKFRSMVPNAEELITELATLNEVDGPLFKMKDDPRVTRVGSILRRLSIDELPQLVNVLRGEMSLVGPRPALYTEMDAWLPELRERLLVRPGLTGLWQVNGRSNLGFADYMSHDLYYVENWSLWSDLAIIAKTIPVLLGKRGAY
jgi:exopolysaccharide biosynthesis polyprenyl glycosylphosphotransferase